MCEINKDISLEEELLNHFNKWEAKINGASQLPIHKTRKKAIDAFQALGIPGPKNEEYKYTPLYKTLKKSFDFQHLSRKSDIGQKEVDKNLIPGLKANKLVFVNGKFSEELSEIISPGDELIIKDFNQATEENKADLDEYFARYADYNADAFIALNTAFAQRGSFIKIADNKVVEAPISLYFINDATQDQVHTQPRNLFLAGKNSQASFVEVFNTEGTNQSLTNVVTEIVVNENAIIDYYKIQNNKETAYHIGTTQVWQARSSNFSAFTFTLSGATIRNNLNITVDAEGCETNMYGLYIINGKTHVDNHTVVDHKEPNCVSNELYKGILEDQSHGVFNGKVFVRQKAQKTNAFQSNKNILLSDEAIINTKPQLEIWADDVKCSHGCTTGQLDEEAMFYLQSRGIGKERARVFLLYAFVVEVLEHIKLDPLKECLTDLISERLHKDF